MAATPLVAIETPTGTTGSDGLAVFTFAADIDTTNHEIVVAGLRRGNTIDYTVTGARQITFVAPSIPLVSDTIWLFNGVSGVTTTTSLPSWATVATLISDAAIELGLVSTDITDPFASTDANILQLLRLLKKAGRELAKHREWKHLQKEYTFSTTSGTNTYALPSDFRKMVDQSSWNRTTDFPVGGPLDGQEWQYFQAVTTASLISKFYRIWQGQLYLYPTPTATETIAFEYQSTSWVKPSGQTSPTSETPTLFSDVVCFDPSLVVTRLKADFRRNKKQDSQSEVDDYLTALRNAENDDSQGATIHLGGRGRTFVRLIDGFNIPTTGYGT